MLVRAFAARICDNLMTGPQIRIIIQISQPKNLCLVLKRTFSYTRLAILNVAAYWCMLLHVFISLVNSILFISNRVTKMINEKNQTPMATAIKALSLGSPWSGYSTNKSAC